MKDTAALRARLLALWGKFDEGKIDTAEARTHIGFARATLDTLKVEIAAAHLSAAVPAVALTADPIRSVRTPRAALSKN